jgi:hypothetical protein
MTEKSLLWVVYRMTIHGKPSGMSAVCEQGEWEAMERDRPGYHTLVLAGITNEGEAERLARSGSGYGTTSKSPTSKRSYSKRLTPTSGTAVLIVDEGGSLVPAGSAPGEAVLP